MAHYFLFLLVAMAAVLSPGPGVLLTMTNAIRYGVSGAIGGIFGLAFGIIIVAGVSATGLGLLLATSSAAFGAMKYIGAIYLIYLGVKLWHSPAVKIEMQYDERMGRKLQFVEGMTLQFTNPKVLFFFISIFPQFIGSSDYIDQFMLFVITYSSLVVVIHFLYANLAKSAHRWFSSERGGRTLNRFGGGAFIFFGIGLVSLNK